MKRQRRLLLWMAGTLLLLLSFNVKAQTYTAKIQGATQVSCNVYEFDVQIARTLTTVFKLAQFQMGIVVNPAMIPAGGVVNVAPVEGSSSSILSAQRPGPEKFSFDASKNCIIVTPVAPPGSAGATTIPAGAGVRFVRIRVACSLPWVAGQGTGHTWNFATATGYQTKMFAYNASNLNVDITVQASHTTVAAGNLVLTNSSAAPVAQSISSDITEVCLLPGAIGAVVTVDATQAGYTYYMYVDGAPIAGVGGVAFGNGGAASFGYKPTAGVITVKSPSCAGNVDMLNDITLAGLTPVTASVSISANPGPNPGTVTFSAAPVNGGLAGPSYQWYVNGAAVDGYDQTYTYDALLDDQIYVEMYSAEVCVTNPVATSNTITIVNAVLCDAPLAFAVTGGGDYCQGGLGVAVGLAGSEADVSYTLSPGGAVVAGTGAAITFGNQLAGTYTVVGTRVCPVLPNMSTNMTGSALVTETPSSTVEFTVGACDTYTWALNGTTYTVSGDYTYVVGCVTNILHLTITPSSTVEFTVGACDTYTWALNGTTYTVSGDYTYVAGCVTNILHLTITPSSTVEFTVGACDTYTWALNGTTYTVSGDYTYVAGCVTNILHLTITPSSTVEFTVGACDTYTWALNGTTYTVSGDYTYVAGCVTNILHLTITPSSTVEFTVGACDTYTWALNGTTYTVSGDYTYVAGCVTNILHLTITPSSTIEFTASACDTYTWALNGTTYTVSGDYTYVVGCVTNILHLTITPSGTNEYTESACDTYTWPVNGQTYTASGNYTYVSGCGTSILHLTITPSSTVEFTASACDTYTWALNGTTYTTGGDYTYVVGCVTNILHLTITPTATATFAAMGPYVQGSVPGTLPATSIEGFTGSWSPSSISTATVGFATYTFTPDGGQCALAGSLTIEVTAIPCNAVETWNGSVSNDWFNAANWTPAAVPCATTAVTVPQVATNYPTLTAVASCASIVVESGASFIGSEFLTTGNALVKQNFPVTGYHYISAPVQMTTFNSVFPLAQNAVWAYSYDEPTGFWMNQTIANTLAVGTGYSVKMTAPQVALFDGQLNQNPVVSSLSNLNTSGVASRAGWNLLGNPFSSALDWNQVTKIGTDGAVYVWNGSGYVSYNAGIGALTGGIIPSVNGFFVKANAPAGSVIIPFAARVHSNIPFYKESIANLISLKAEANNYSDETFVNFNESASSAFDAQFDAYKLQNIANAPALYSMITGDILSINALPMEGNEVVDLGFKCGVNGTYSINASGIESFDATTPVWLEDLKTGAKQNLRTNASYSFDYTTADNEKRFKLHFKSAYSVPENSLSGINIYSASRTVVINNTTSLAGEVKIYDLAGRELTHTSMNSSNETRIAVNYAVGTYLVKVITEKGVASNKVFIR